MKLMQKLKKFAIEALLGFILWTLFLTPYMWFIVKTTIEQYTSWLMMQAVIVPLIAIIVVNITNKIVGKLAK